MHSFSETAAAQARELSLASMNRHRPRCFPATLIRRRIDALILALRSVPKAAAAQTNTGEIFGVVSDAQGGLLTGTTVVAEHVETRQGTVPRTAQARASSAIGRSGASPRSRPRNRSRSCW